VHPPAGDLIGVSSGIKLQDEDQLVRLIDFIDETIFTKPDPESGLVTFAFLDIEIG